MIHKEQVISLIRDFIPFIRADELTQSFILPLKMLYELIEGIHEKKCRKWIKQGLEHLPSIFWKHIKERHPQTAAFPLGPISERSVKRLLGRIILDFSNKEKGDRNLQKIHKKLNVELKRLNKGSILYNYASFFIFEMAMLNLRGSHDELERDFGFLYHQSDRNKLKSLKEEKELRKAVMDQSKKAASLLMKSLKKKGAGSLVLLSPETVVSAFFKVFQAVPRKPPKWITTSSPRPFTVLSQKGAVKKIGKKRISDHAKIISASGKEANIFIGSKKLLECCGNGLHSLLKDLLEIAATIYMADIHIPRNELMARDLTFYMPVRHPEVWQNCSEYLSRPIRFLSGNMVGFKFIESKEDRSPEKKFNVSSKNKRIVSLFSGGLDSFVGATKLLENQYETFLVSHYASNILKGIQNDLFKVLKNKYKNQVTTIPVPVHAARKKISRLYKLGRAPQQELVQYTRSFLFLTLASCIAISNGIKDVNIFENGVVAINPVFSEARFNTKTAHPIFIKYFKELIHKVFGVKLNIQNPFLNLTKGEVLKSLDKHWYQYLSKTNSCWAYSHVKAWSSQLNIDDFSGMHCGRCIPCIWRRAAMNYAGIENVDDSYLLDKISGQKQWLTRGHLTVLIDLYRYCQNISQLSKVDLLNLHPDFYDENGDLEERIKMLKKYSNQEIIPWFEDNNEVIQHYVNY